jgi:hypothetical protein
MINIEKFVILFFSIILIVVSSAFSQSKPLLKKNQIKAATSPAPADLQEGAKVLGYNEQGELISLRDGTNHLICIADDPEQTNFHVSCYHKDLEPFMKRGRELKAKGLSRKKVDSVRREEIEKGELAMPQKPMALYSLTGSENAFDYETGQVINASPLYVVYIPFATEASTGLSKEPPSKGAPWIMEPGTPWAHIMVMTGRKIGRN